jgi:hypothetical protein
VQTVFTLISPTIRGHLQLLARLSAVLHDRGVRDVLKRHADRDVVVAEARRVEASLAQKHTQAAASRLPASGSEGE